MQTQSRSVASVGAIAALLLCLPTADLQATVVGGPIVSDTTWSAARNPYTVMTNVIVGGGATLTIDAGVEVRFAQGGVLLIGSLAFGPGTIVAEGTEAEPIVFTTNEAAAAPGDWSRVQFSDLAVDAVFDESGYVSGCKLEHVIIEYAGGGQAAVVIESCSPYLINCEIRHNAARGISVDGTSSPPMRIDACEIWDCVIPGSGEGGGILLTNGGSGHALTGNFIHDCFADGHGGGIAVLNIQGVTLTGNTISSNTGIAGGGIYIVASHNASLIGNTINDNSASSGGGIDIGVSDNIMLIDNTVSGNSAASHGGGIHVGNSTGSTLMGNVISDNSAATGPGGAINATSNQNMTLVQNCLTGNSTSLDGGAIWAQSCHGCNLSDSTITNNSAENEGGAIFLENSNGWVLSGNQIMANSAGGEAGGIYLENSMDLSLAGVPGVSNRIVQNSGCQIRNTNSFETKPGGNVDATYVDWGTNDPDVIQQGICDFFDNANWAVVVASPAAPGTGSPDTNNDGVVDVLDLIDLLLCFGEPADPGCESEDINLDGTINVLDLINLLLSFGAACS